MKPEEQIVLNSDRLTPFDSRLSVANNLKQLTEPGMIIH